jgi:hypothetical protein
MQLSSYDEPVDVLHYSKFQTALRELSEHHEESDAYYDEERLWENYKKLYIMAVRLTDV